MSGEKDKILKEKQKKENNIYIFNRWEYFFINQLTKKEIFNDCFD